MKILLITIAALFLTISPLSNDVQSALTNDETAFLQIRAGKHSDFIRIVLEGPEALISKGKVSQKDRNILVSFAEIPFALQQQKLPVPYRKNDNTVIFAMNNPADLKVFSLDNPDRIVIDAYQKAPDSKSGTEERDKDVPEKNSDKDTKKTVSSGSNKDSESAAHPKEVQKKNDAKKEAASDYAGIKDLDKLLPEQTDEEKPTYKDDDTTLYDDSFIPEKYKKYWVILKKDGNPFKVIAELPAYRPADVGSIAAYHFIQGEALGAMKNHIDAIKHLRLAYIYASDEKLKELSLIRRAEEYVKLGFLYEARNNYSVFISDYPSSQYIAKAHLGIANCLSETGDFTEAVEHYGKAGNSTEVLFNMANALQKLEKVDEARKAYVNAMHVDGTYPARSPETYYLFAENLRMSGSLKDAKKLLSTITTGTFRDNASVSLGLIAMDEQNNEEAVKHFQSITFTRNMKVRVKALFNLSLAYLRSNKLNESISTLEEVRKKYPDSSMYDEALLVLSKLYKHEGKVKESVALLKELVYGNQPPQEAFTELETILLEASQKTDSGSEGALRFTDLWREVGQWMLDATRGEFLLKMAERLKPEGKPFLELCSWLAENTSGNVRMTAALNLADYYAGLENISLTEEYLNVVKEAGREVKYKESNDAILRLDAKVNHAGKNHELALKNLMAIKEFDDDNFTLLGKIIDALKQSNSNSVKQGIAFYEKMINKFGGEAEDYARLADIFYQIDEEKALAYYRTAYEKNPKDEWTAYRMGLIVDRTETDEMFSRLEKGDTILSRLAKTKRMEINLINKIEEVYQ